MQKTAATSRRGFFGKKLYFFIALISCGPVYIVIHAFINTMHVNDDEQIAVAITMFFFAGIFTGRYLSQSWAATFKSMPLVLLTTLFLLIAGSIVWIFIHADYPLENRNAINILLYWVPFVIISVSLGVTMKIINAVNQNQLRDAQSSAEHSHTELQLLQSQLSPHFLFNTLNNLYGLSITQHEKIPALLLKLSELLRYSVYNTNETYVPLKDEITYINNYIEFEKIRIGERLILTIDIEEVKDQGIKIAPMLLIVFVENAFKHAKNSAEQEIYIDIALKTFGNLILFAVKNSHSDIKEQQRFIDKDSGFGLASVYKRLGLLYPGEHDLEIEKDEAVYKVLLRLKTK